ncbi:MAG: hypothetical protein ACPGUE_09885 [Marinomonas sp.]
MIIAQSDSSLPLSHVLASEYVSPSRAIPSTFGRLVITLGDKQDVNPVALRCEAPLDAMELEQHGYHYGFFERGNEVCMETFVTLSKLGIHTLAYFCDVNGPQFDMEKMAEFAQRFDVKLCKVLLPFDPHDFALWDEWQWRIFDNRLSQAVSDTQPLTKPIKLLTGGSDNAPIH